MVVERESTEEHKRKERDKKAWDKIRNENTKKIYKTTRVRQRRQLRWRRNVRMIVCMLERKETKEGEKELYRLARQRGRAGKNV